MTRLETLKKELETINSFRTMSFDLKDQCTDYYQREIDAIEKYGASNPEYEKKGE